MTNKLTRNRRQGIVLLLTAAVISTILLVPSVVMGKETTLVTGKTPGTYKVGEVVSFTGTIAFNDSAAEVADMSTVTLSIAPDTSDSDGGSESFSVALPLSIGNHSLTSSLPAEMQTRGSTLEVNVSWSDMGPNTGGYSFGYKGASADAEISYTVQWLPAVLKTPPPAPPPAITAPATLFENPGGEVATEDAIEATFKFMGPTIPEPGAEILGLAFDRYYWVLKVLTDDPDPAEGDWVVEVDPETGEVYGLQQLARSDAQDIAWTQNPGDNPKSVMQEGTTWVSFGDAELGVTTIEDLAGNLPDRVIPAATEKLAPGGLGGHNYPGNNDPSLISASMQTGEAGIPVYVQDAAGANNLLADFNLPSGPTGGGYTDVVLNDTTVQDSMMGQGPFTAFGSNGSQIAEFDVGNGSFLQTGLVKANGQELLDIVGLALDPFGTMYLADNAGENDPMIYTSDFGQQGGGQQGGQQGGGQQGGGGGPVQARAIATDYDSGEIYLVMDNQGQNGNDQVVITDADGNLLGQWDLPMTQFENMTFLDGSLYSVAEDQNWTPALWKFDPHTGVPAAGFPANLPIQGQVGGLTTNVAGTKLIGVARNFNDLITIDPVKMTTMNKPMNPDPGSQMPWPNGFEGVSIVTGCPDCPLLVGVIGTQFYYVNPMTGNITDFAQATSAPPYNITGIAQWGSDQLIMTDDSQQVMAGGLPSAADPETTTKGDYTATLTDNENSDSDTADFTIKKVKTVAVTIASPSEGDSFTTQSISVSGTVNDPTVTSVSLGIDLPSTDLIGPETFDSGDEGWTLTGLWNQADSFKTTARVSSGDTSLAYTDSATNNFCVSGGQPYNNCQAVSGKAWEVNGVQTAGTATSAPFVVGAGSELTFSTWYDTEPGNMFDKKMIKIVAGTTAHSLAIINDFPPMINGQPSFNAAPGTVYTDPFQAGVQQIFLPSGEGGMGMAMTELTEIKLDIPTSYIGQTVSIQFAFDSNDGWGNGGEGWFIDDVGVTGAGSSSGQSATVTNLAWSGSFTLAAGSNAIQASAVRTAYDAQSASATVNVSMDISKPMLKILLTEDLDGDGVLGADEDIDGNSAITTLPLVTNVAMQTIFGSYDELNPATLTVHINDKLVKTIKSGWDADDTTWYAQVNLTSGTNAIVVNLTDSGGLEPDATDTVNNVLTESVVLDTTGPVLTALTPVYPYTATAATPGDPIVWQITATDADTSVSTVTLGPTESMVASSALPDVLTDQWGTTGNYLAPTIVPASAPPGSYSLNITATDAAGNASTATVTAQIVASMTAWNVCLQRGANLVSVPIQPTDGSIGTLLDQVVTNGGAGVTKVSDAVTSIQYWTGGRTGTGSFEVYAGLPSDDLSEIMEGRAYWIFTDAAKFKAASPLPGFSASSYSCLNMTVAGLFLSPGEVPPVFDVDEDWNMVGRHTEEDTTVEKFLKSVTVPTQTWSSLMTYKNAQDFDYANTDNLSMSDRVTQTLGSFQSRTDMSDPVNRGEGFWLFLLTDGVITP